MADHRPEDRFRLPQAVPLMHKAMEIRELVDHILEAAPEAKPVAQAKISRKKKREEEFRREALKDQINDMYGASILIPAKIAGAEGGDLYDIRMENAALIRKAARELVVGLRGLELFGYDEQPYFDLLRTEIEAFRKLFVAWVQAFDMNRFITDDWGLFNPPGVKPGDNLIGNIGHGDEHEEDDIGDLFNDGEGSNPFDSQDGTDPFGGDDEDDDLPL